MMYSLSQESFHQLREFIFTKCGLEFPEGKNICWKAGLA